VERKKILIYKENIQMNEIQKLTGLYPEEFLQQLGIKEPVGIDDFKTLSEFMEFNFVSDLLSKEENLHFFSRPFPNREKKVIVSIVGHVNHGKTTLVDQIRKTKVAESEVGGITQNVSFYNIKYKDQSFILIDTPGHAAFSDMRKLILNVSDIVVLLVAADDGVQEQTKEIAKHLHDKNVIVCINKIDKGEKNISRIHSDLSHCRIVSKEFGGEIETIQISAKKDADILLDAVVREIKDKKFKNYHDRLAIGTVVDVTLKEGVGIIAEVLFQHGIAKTKDFFVCDGQNNRIKTIISGNKTVQSCQSVEIVSIVGFDSIPSVGSKFFVVPDADFRSFLPEKDIAENKMFDKDQNFICKSDQESKLKTLVDTISQYGNVIDSSIGVIKKTEIDLAKTFKATFVLWQKTPSSFLSLISQSPEVKYIQDEVIYQIQEQVENLNRKPEEKKLVESGTMKIIKTFTIKNKNIAGCKVLSGKVEIGSKCVIKRNDEEVIWGKIDSLQKEKKDIEEARKGTECGIILRFEKNTVDNFEEGDEVIVFEK
jgi:translation initiation factor IF-2